MKRLILALLLLPMLAFAGDEPWNPDLPVDYTPPPKDYNWAQKLAWNTKELPTSEWVFVAASVADAWTTTEALNYPNVHETNVLLGKHPSDIQVIGFAAITTLGHMWLIHYAQTDKAPRLVVYSLIGLGILIRGYGITSNIQSIHDGQDWERQWDAMQIGAGP